MFTVYLLLKTHRQMVREECLLLLLFAPAKQAQEEALGQARSQE